MAEKKSKINQKYFVDAWLEDPLMVGCAKSKSVIHRPAAHYVTRRLNCPLWALFNYRPCKRKETQRCCGEAK